MSSPGATAPGALVVPDEQTWTMAGADPAAGGVRPVFALGEAERLLVPEVLPAVLDAALQPCLAALPADVEVEARPLHGIDGRPLRLPDRSQHEVESEHEAHRGGDHGPGGEHAGHAGRDVHAEHDMHGGHAEPEMHGGHGEHGMHGGHGMHGDHGDHGDMMAIVGEPSADGLVMEPIDLRFGPVGTPLPGGLAVEVTLDGDVVAESTVHPLLSAEPPAAASPSPPDLLAPVAWALAIEAAAEDGGAGSSWRKLAALELERTVSHLAWLRALGRLLGWPLLVDRCTRALEGLPPLAHRLAGRGAGTDDEVLAALGRAATRVENLAALVVRSRLLRLRAAGLGVLTAEEAAEAGLRGPVARASGLQDDARAGHPLYDRLGFEPVVGTGGDAHARTLLRAEEAWQSMRLAQAALRADPDGALPAAGLAAADGQLEGPRGPISADRRSAGWRFAAPGSREAVEAAAQAMVGAEWAAALVALASFDLSPWTVGA